MKKSLLIVGLLCSSFIGGAFAQSFGGGIVRAFANSFPTVLTQNGTSQFIYNSWAALFWELSQGTSGAPVTAAGPLFKVSRTDNMLSAACGGSTTDAECDAAASVYSVGSTTATVQQTGLFAGSTAQSTKDAVALFAVGRMLSGGSGIGTGAYIEGERTVNTGKFLGAEIRAENNTATSSTYNASGFASGSLWLSAQSTGAGVLVGNGVALGSVAGSMFDVGYSATQGSVATTTFRDDSSSVTSMVVNGSHTNGINMSGATFIGQPILAPLATPANSSAACVAGGMSWDASFVYVCTATNTWKRATLGTF